MESLPPAPAIATEQPPRASTRNRKRAPVVKSDSAPMSNIALEQERRRRGGQGQVALAISQGRPHHLQHRRRRLCNDINENSGISFDAEANSESDAAATKATILDLYSGWGGMSTGLCLGAVIAGLQIETRWAVDLNTNAWESFKYNHPITEVRNEKVEDFLLLLQEWSVLCDKYIHKHNDDASASPLKVGGEEHELGKGKLVIDKLTAICYGGAKREKCIYFKGDVDVLCGGPPCQGLSGNNRHRKCDKPLDDDKNRQIVTFMDIVSFLKPKYVLMENVADILKLNGGSVGRYALSRLVALNYQSRMGLMVAGCCGLPQFQMRMFLWGALPTMVLPKYPLPTHGVVVRGGAPSAFSVSNDETADETVYNVEAKTDFQRYIRLSRKEMLDYSFGDNKGPEDTCQPQGCRRRHDIPA
uniref:DNA (cytosine-5-)-methyltransferase n=1 Tax=Aegilops tauschii TaxID=37682 RepID=M8C361_AEGTA